MSFLLLALAAFPSQMLPYVSRPDPGRLGSPAFDDGFCPRLIRGFDCAVRLLEGRAHQRGVQAMIAAARSGDTRAMRALGLMLVRGEYVRQDQELALGFFYEAARHGDRESMSILSTAFEKGIGTSPDPRIAAYWRARASASH